MICGIDYSMTSPALCFGEPGASWNDCKIHYLTSLKKCQGIFKNIEGTPYPDSIEQDRFDRISSWALSWIIKYNPTHVFIEDYAFAATGRVFHIAENTGLLKHKLWKQKVPFTAFAPTSIKKFATGKGNAKKEDMEVAFKAETSYNLKEVLTLTEKQWNPSSDIIDAYYIFKLGSKQTNG